MAAIAVSTTRSILCLALTIYYWIIIIRLLLSWFPNPPDAIRPIYRVLYDITEPLLRLVRPLIPPIRTGGMALDLSPILVFVALLIAQRVVCR